MRLRHELRAEGLADHFEDASLHLQFVSHWPPLEPGSL